MKLLSLVVASLLCHVALCYVTTGSPNTECILGDLSANPDGDCMAYYQCAYGLSANRLVGMRCAPGTVFSEVWDTCVHRGSELDKCTSANVHRECENGGASLIPHPTSCERYFDCSDDSPRGIYNLFQKYEKECEYPEVFDINLKQCVGFETATCGAGRVAAKWVCDYLANRCGTSHCRPCNVDNPSCIGKADGVWPTIKVGSPYFTTCKSERSLNGEERCGLTNGVLHLFHPSRRQCVPFSEYDFYD